MAQIWSVLEAKMAIFQAEKSNGSKWTSVEIYGVVEKAWHLHLAVLDSFLQIDVFKNECCMFPHRPLPVLTGNLQSKPET